MKDNINRKDFPDVPDVSVDELLEKEIKKLENEDKKVLVTGGAGFIGSHIVDCLLDKGYDVCVIDNLSTGDTDNINEKIINNSKFYEYDITKPKNVYDVLEIEKPDIVIHAAAKTNVRESFKKKLFYDETNIDGTINLLEACVGADVKKVIFTSTGGAIYGNPNYLPVDENHPANPISPYSISKLAAEHYVKISDLDYLILRFGNVYGPRDKLDSGRVIPVFISDMLNGRQPKIFGDGKQTRDFIYVEDLSNFIVDCIGKNPEHKIFNLGKGVEVSINDVFNYLKKIIGFNGEAKYVEEFKGEVNENCLYTALARFELGWNPKTNFKQGLNETFKWFKLESNLCP